MSEATQQARPAMAREITAIRAYRNEHPEGDDALAFHQITMPGKIGRGTKVHSFDCYACEWKGELLVTAAYSYCGSQRFSSGGFSGLRIMPHGTEITCQKCR